MNWLKKSSRKYQYSIRLWQALLRKIVLTGSIGMFVSRLTRVHISAILVLSIPGALGFNLWSGFHPFTSGSTILDLEDFFVSNCALPLGSLCYVLFCVSKKGWGFENLLAEANAGKGAKFPRWAKPYVTFVVPCAIILLFLIGIVTFKFTDTFTIWGWVTNLI